MNSRGLKAAVASIILTTVVIFIILLFKAPLASVPLDAGWVGILLIFANGFFLSYLLAPKVSLHERVLLTVGLGFGLTFTLMILLGLSWGFSFFSVLITEGILLLVFFVGAIRQGFRLKTSTGFALGAVDEKINGQNMLTVLLLVVIAVFAFVALYNTLALPATEWDSLAYGVNYAKIIFEKGTIPLIAGPSIGIEMSAAYPPGVQLTAVSLYTLAGNANDFYYRLLSPIFSVATLLATYTFAHSVNKNRTFAVYAAFGLSLVPYFWELFIQETYLMGLTLMFTLTALFFYKAYQSDSSDSRRYELIGALFCGFAALTSYMGLFAFGILFIYAVIKRIEVKRLAVLMAVGVIIILPWYLRNTVLLANPLYPFFGLGNYLDPLLKSSTAQHFQSYLLLPEYSIISTVSKIAAGVLIVAIGYFVFSKRRNLLAAFSLFALFVGFTVMGFHVAFLRYMIVAFPAVVVVCSVLLYAILRKYESTKITAAVVLSLVVIASIFMLPYIESVKPPPKPGEDQAAYLSRLYEEGDAWNWINQNTPVDCRVATFDIKQYYIQRDIMQLDGNESAQLYTLTTIEHALSFLQSHNVSYILSVPWASPTDNRLPSAYNECILTRYFGDPSYLPPVFVGQNGTTVYHVGALNLKVIEAAFTQRNLTMPIRHITVNVTITNTTSSNIGDFYLPIPVDYRNGSLVASVNTSKLIFLELWTGLIPAQEIETPAETSMFIIGCNNSYSAQLFSWHIDRAGYFTVRIFNTEEHLQDSFNVTVDLRFYNYWDLCSTS